MDKVFEKILFFCYLNISLSSDVQIYMYINYFSVVHEIYASHQIYASHFCNPPPAVQGVYLDISKVFDRVLDKVHWNCL